MILGIETIALSIAAFVSSYTFGDVLGILFHYDATTWIIVAMVAWSAAAWATRRIRVGQTTGLYLETYPIVGWVLLRVALLFSCGILLAGWLTALATGSTITLLFIRAAALLMVVSFVVSVTGGAAINSWLAAKGGRRDIAL
ncbi:hypothetical protein [Sphingomonas rustica]|uniref:hypothetical protein n=1 Tax=Sphingomonas rustica TaxID=3103142 RepID=UPI0031FC99C8